MFRIQELPDDLDDSLDLDAPPSAPPKPSDRSPAAPIPQTPFPLPAKVREQHGPTPTLPPQMESVRSHTADEILTMMNQTPLFMTSLENTDAEGKLYYPIDAIVKDAFI